MDLTARAGRPFTAAWEVVVDGLPIAAPWVARCQVREYRALNAPELHTFTAVVDAGRVIITATPEETGGWAWAQGAYDVVIDDDSPASPITVDAGTITIEGSVTE